MSTRPNPSPLAMSSTLHSTSTSSVSSKHKVNTELDLEDMRSGFSSAVPSGVTTILVNGNPLTPADVVREIDRLLPIYAKADTDHATWAASVAARKAIGSEAAHLLSDLRKAVRAIFPNDAGSQAKFGLTPGKPRKASSLSKAAAAVKGKATRAKNKPPAAKPQAAVVLIGPDGNPIAGSEGAPLPAPATATPGGAGK